jgi:hypothetical protein
MFYGKAGAFGASQTGDIRPMHVSSTNRPGLSGSGRMVASPDIDPYWGNFRVGGHLSGTPEIGPLFENCPSILRDFLCAKCH